LIVANAYLEHELVEVRASVSHGFVRGKGMKERKHVWSRSSRQRVERDPDQAEVRSGLVASEHSSVLEHSADGNALDGDPIGGRQARPGEDALRANPAVGEGHEDGLLDL
jgi:hypothetical protein